MKPVSMGDFLRKQSGMVPLDSETQKKLCLDGYDAAESEDLVSSVEYSTETRAFTRKGHELRFRQATILCRVPPPQSKHKVTEEPSVLTSTKQMALESIDGSALSSRNAWTKVASPSQWKVTETGEVAAVRCTAVAIPSQISTRLDERFWSDWLVVDSPKCREVAGVPLAEAFGTHRQLRYLKREINELRSRVETLEGNDAMDDTGDSKKTLAIEMPKSKAIVQKLQLSESLLQKRKKRLRKAKKSRRRTKKAKDESSDVLDEDCGVSNAALNKWVVVKPSAKFQRELSARVKNPRLKRAKHLMGSTRRKDPHKVWLQTLVLQLNASKAKLKKITSPR